MEIDDIEIIYKLDESKNQRIIIFRREEDVEPINIITSSNKNESYVHGVYLKEYLNKEYLDDESLQNVKDKAVYSARSIIQYLVNRYGNVIFAETTDDNKSRREGMFFIPEQLGENTYTELEKLREYFSNFQTLLIQGCNDENVQTKIYYDDELDEMYEYLKSITDIKTKRGK